MAAYRGIHHLAMATNDMDRTIRFWRDLLGMRLVVGMGRAGHRQYFFEISENALLGFFEWPEVEPVPEKDHGYPARGPLVFDHVAFEVTREDELWELKEKLDTAGFWVSEVIDHGFIHSIYSFDPNGIPIEFSCAVSHVDVRKHPRMIDPSPSPTTLEGPDPQPDKWPYSQSASDETEKSIYPGEGTELTSGNKKDWWKTYTRNRFPAL